MDEPTYMLVYTTETGGSFQTRPFTPQEFDRLLETERLRVNYDSDSLKYVDVKFAMLCRVENDFDFILGRKRGKYA